MDAPNRPAPRPLDPQPQTGDPTLDALVELRAIVTRLREPVGGCPWDLEQTTASLAPSLVEEAHELVDALERMGRGDERDAVEEAGDLLMAHFLLCHIADQEGRFDLARVAREVSQKLIRRHPHVFGEEAAFGSAAVVDADAALSQWERIKKAERERKRAEGRWQEDTSSLAGVPVALPALQRAQRIGQKAMSAGFRWGDAGGAMAKVREELEELEEAFARMAEQPSAREEVVRELGDLLLAAVQLSNYLAIDAEAAARAAVGRFEARFRAMERELGGSLEGRDLPSMMAAWQRAKLALRSS